MKHTFLKVSLFTILSVFVCGMIGCSSDKSDTKVQPETTTLTTTEQQNETTQTSEQAQVSEKNEDFFVSLERCNSWEQDGKVCIQYDGKIVNQSSNNAKNWKVFAVLPEAIEITDSWNGQYTIEGNNLCITPVDYNQEIMSKSEITFGFIVQCKKDFTIEQATLSIDGTDYLAQTKEEVNTGTEKETNKETKKEEKKETIVKKERGIPVKKHGALNVKGNDIVDKNGNVFQLKGISTHGLAWFPEYVNKEAFSSLSEYGVNTIRFAMYTAENGGYCTDGNPTQLEELVIKGADICTELGMYAIIDWHILSDSDPNVYKDKAKAFFEKMSKKYADHDNIIYEICNEPCNGTTWQQIKTYAEEIIPIIRKNDKNAIIIVGTPNWSQDVDIASNDPIQGYENIMYAVHFYASTHKEDIRNKVKVARENGLAIIVSECSICEASGNGTIDYDEAEKWIDYVNSNQMSIVAWNLSNKDENSSIIKPNVTKTAGFEKEDFSETGIWFMEQYSK